MFVLGQPFVTPNVYFKKKIKIMFKSKITERTKRRNAKDRFIKLNQKNPDLVPFFSKLFILLYLTVSHSYILSRDLNGRIDYFNFQLLSS